MLHSIFLLKTAAERETEYADPLSLPCTARRLISGGCLDLPKRLEEAVPLLKQKPEESTSVAVRALMLGRPRRCRCFTAQSRQTDWETLFVFPYSIWPDINTQREQRVQTHEGVQARSGHPNTILKKKASIKGLLLQYAGSSAFTVQQKSSVMVNPTGECRQESEPRACCVLQTLLVLLAVWRRCSNERPALWEVLGTVAGEAIRAWELEAVSRQLRGLLMRVTSARLGLCCGWSDRYPVPTVTGRTVHMSPCPSAKFTSWCGTINSPGPPAKRLRQVEPGWAEAIHCLPGICFQLLSGLQGPGRLSFVLLGLPDDHPWLRESLEPTNCKGEAEIVRLNEPLLIVRLSLPLKTHCWNYLKGYLTF